MRLPYRLPLWTSIPAVGSSVTTMLGCLDSHFSPERDKMLTNDVVRHRQCIEAMQGQLAEDEGAYTNERACVEMGSMY
jgi:hypothetical protein